MTVSCHAPKGTQRIRGCLRGELGAGGFDAVERGPEGVGGGFGAAENFVFAGLERGGAVGCGGVEFAVEEIGPDCGVVDVGGFVDAEVFASGGVGCVLVAEAAAFFCCDAGDLRFVGVEGGDGGGWGCCLG